MGLFVIFLCGVANFAVHKASMESDHPVMAQMRASLGRLANGRGSYILEFVILLSALSFARMGSALALPFYLAYTAMNGAAAWIILRR
ncbi:MAG: hypothetical protein R3E02_14155 [Blastomonas sp.]